MKVLVVGAGAVGGLLGAALSRGGAELTWLARGERGRRLAAEGLRVERGAEAWRVRAEVVESMEEAAVAGPFAAVLLAVRGMDVEALGADIGRALPPARLLVMLNGVGHEARLQALLPRHRVLAGSLTAACWEAAPGVVGAGLKGGVGLECGEAGGVGADAPDRTGETDGAEGTDGAWVAGGDGTDLVAAFTAGGLAARCYDDGAALKWSKLLLNLLGSATTAILGWPPARVFADRRLFELELAAWREALAVMAALGLRPLALPGYPVPVYAALVRRLPGPLRFRLLAPRLAGGRGDRLPGPAADLARGRRRTECEWLGGAVARSAGELGLAAPVNAGLSALVADLAAGRRPREAFRDRPEALLDEIARAHGR